MKNNLLFCENCNELTENEICPKCGAPTREPQDNDMCFVQELSGINVNMYADALSNNDIEFVHVPSFSVNVTSAPALQGVNYYNTPSSYKFYVHFADYEQAIDVYQVLFAEQPQELRDEDWIDRIVTVTIDRPRGSVHPRHPNIVYPVNYGYVEGVIGGDGEYQDAYVLDYNLDDVYVGKQMDCFVVAVIRRKNDVETKLVTVFDPRHKYTKEQISSAVNFQEKFFDIEIIM